MSDLPWIRAKPSVTTIVDGFKAQMAAMSAKDDKPANWLPYRREVDEALLDLDHLTSLMTPFCHEPYAQPTRRLAKLSALFIRTPLHQAAVALGWSAADLFGIHWGLHERDIHGLIASVSLSTSRLKIIGIDRDGAKIATENKRTGMRGSIVVYRPHPWPRTVPFWNCEGVPRLDA